MSNILVSGVATASTTLSQALTEAEQLVVSGQSIVLLVDTTHQLSNTVIAQYWPGKQLRPNGTATTNGGISVKFATKLSGFHPNPGDVVLAYFATDPLMDFVHDKNTLNHNVDVVVVEDLLGAPNWVMRTQPTYVPASSQSSPTPLFQNQAHDALVENEIDQINKSSSVLHRYDKNKLKLGFKALKNQGHTLVANEVRNKAMTKRASSVLADSIAKLI
ncbi:hypothetical protein [Pseudovibrio sp. POLY-S9]|uniref:hypothetical protein n=1 Tax=Pseudovibrio sp. POLY-S9 TaxID=1576596 RepID=UPI000708DEF2|nr:hypothetical protein [Pseudovibrio sp. POLY-S9]